MVRAGMEEWIKSAVERKKIALAIVRTTGKMRVVEIEGRRGIEADAEIAKAIKEGCGDGMAELVICTFPVVIVKRDGADLLMGEHLLGEEERKGKSVIAMLLVVVPEFGYWSGVARVVDGEVQMCEVEVNDKTGLIGEISKVTSGPPWRVGERAEVKKGIAEFFERIVEEWKEGEKVSERYAIVRGDGSVEEMEGTEEPEGIRDGEYGLSACRCDAAWYDVGNERVLVAARGREWEETWNKVKEREGVEVGEGLMLSSFFRSDGEDKVLWGGCMAKGGDGNVVEAVYKAERLSVEK